MDLKREWKTTLESEMKINTKRDGFFYTRKGSIRKQIKAVLPYLWHPVLKSFMNRIEASPIGTQSKYMEGTMMDALNEVYPDIDESEEDNKPRTTKHSISEDLVLMQKINIGENQVDDSKLDEITRTEGTQGFNPILVKAYQVTQNFSLTGKGRIFQYLSEGEGASQTMYYLYRDRERILQAYDFFARNLLIDVIEDNSSPYDKQWFPGVKLSDEGPYIGGFDSPNLIAGEISSWMMAQHTDSTVSKFYALIGAGDTNTVTRAIAKDVLENYKTQDWYKVDRLDTSVVNGILDDAWKNGFPFGVRPIQAKPGERKKDVFMTKEEVLNLMEIENQKQRIKRLIKSSGRQKDTTVKKDANDVLEYMNKKELLDKIRVLRNGVKKIKDVPLLDLEKHLVEWYSKTAGQKIIAVKAKKEKEKEIERLELKTSEKEKEIERLELKTSEKVGKRIETRNTHKIKEFMSAYDKNNKQNEKTRALKVGKKITGTLTDKHMSFFSQHSVMSEHCAHRKTVQCT